MLMMSQPGAHNVLGGGYAGIGISPSGGLHSRHRSLPSPRADHRRVIFPSLHHHHGSRSPSCTQPKPGHEQFKRSERTKSEDLSPTEVESNIENITMGPVILRANSLDGILIPLSKFSLNEESKSNEEFAPQIAPRPLNQRNKEDPIIQPQSAPPGKWTACPPHGSSSFDTKSPSKSRFIGGPTRHKTYYPATSVPTPVSDKKKPSHSKPPVSILRRKVPFSPTTPTTTSRQKSYVSSTSCPPSEAGGSALTPPQPPQSTISPSLSPAVPTLASPSRIESLHARDNNGDPQRKHPNSGDKRGEGIGDSEYDLTRISDSPKILPRKCKLNRIQSDNIVSKSENNEEQRPRGDSFASSSHESCVTRHTSLECLSSNKRISFDPHITVYEFGINNYERKGGEKWFSEDELTQFKQEAIQRIRLRSMQVIPTGTGRALAVATKNKTVHDKGSRGSTVNAQQGRPKGSISFNHPALGCDDEFDPQSQSSREVAIKAHLSQEIRNILVVDPHEIFLALFTKSLKHMVPHASVATARSAEEAMTRIEAAQNAFSQSDGGSTHGFDIIIIEERLRSSSFPGQQLASGPQHTSRTIISTQTAGDDSIQRRWSKSSGSALIRHLAELELRLGKSEGDDGTCRRSLLVGVTARMALDQQKLEKAGADCVWGKPPPEMNATLRNSLLKLLMKKRRSADLQLFD